MTGLLLIVTLGILATSVLQFWVDWLNVRHAESQPAPREFASLVSPEKYAESVRYLKAKTKDHLVDRVFGLGAFLGMLLFGGFRWLDGWSSGLGLGPIPTSLIFFGALGLASEVFSLPFQWHSTFGTETRFGFNRSTVRTFLMDQVKGLVLGVLVGGPVLAAVFWFFLAAGDNAWLIAWVFLALFQLVLGVLAPVVLMPLFNKFTPLEPGPLKEAIERYADSVAFRVQGIFTMDGSKRSSKANAFFTGLGGFRRIVLFDTLVQKHSVPELVAVLAHEVGHFRRRHVVKNMAVSLGYSLILFYLLSRVMANPSLTASLGFPAHSLHVVFLAAYLLYLPFSFLPGIAMRAMSRKFEFEADAFAVTTTGDGASLADGLGRLSADQLSNLNPHPWKVWMEYSHPPLLQRVRAIRGR